MSYRHTYAQLDRPTIVEIAGLTKKLSHSKKGCIYFDPRERLENRVGRKLLLFFSYSIFRDAVIHDPEFHKI